MLQHIRNHIARNGTNVSDNVINHITTQNASELNRMLRNEWNITDIRFEPACNGTLNVVFNHKKYTAAESLHILVRDDTVLMYLNASDQQKCLRLYSFTVRVFRRDELLAINNGGPLPDEVDLSEERIIGTDSMDEVVRKTLRLLRAKPV
jgi:hypothetical protein